MTDGIPIGINNKKSFSNGYTIIKANNTLSTAPDAPIVAKSGLSLCLINDGIEEAISLKNKA